MAFQQAFLVQIAVLSSMIALGMSFNWGPNGGGNWNPGFNKTNCPYTHPNSTTTHPPNSSGQKIIVGGAAHWQFGVNYLDWAAKNGPFFVNDTLVFMFDAPNATTHAHSVYLLPNQRAFARCDVRRGKKLADPTQGGGNGFEFVLQKWQPYYFSCGEKDGFHCSNGTMKFAVMPMLRRFHF